MNSSAKFICKTCNLSFKNYYFLHKHFSSIKHQSNLKTKNKSNQINEEIEIEKEFNIILSDFLIFSNFFEIYSTEILYDLFKNYYSKELKEFKNFLSSLDFLSEEIKNNNYKDYKLKIDNKLLQIEKNLKERNSQGNKNRKIQEKELKIIIEKLSIILERELNKIKENKKICLFCKNYFTSITKHILFFQNKEIYCCRYIIKSFFKLSSLQEQINFLNIVFNYFFHGFSKIPFKNITKYIKKETLNVSNNLSKINKKKDLLKILSRVYNKFYNENDYQVVIELEESDTETTV